MMKKTGFGLLEMMLVLVVIVTLGFVVANQAPGGVKISEEEQARAAVESYDQAVYLFHAHTGTYPTAFADLLVKPAVNGWSGPYTHTQSFVDPWGRAYQLRHPGKQGRAYEILSVGVDGKEGTPDDITSWRDPAQETPGGEPKATEQIARK